MRVNRRARVSVVALPWRRGVASLAWARVRLRLRLRACRVWGAVDAVGRAVVVVVMVVVMVESGKPPQPFTASPLTGKP